MEKNAFYDIDFVVTWVDDTDPIWTSDKEKYMEKKTNEGNREARFRDWDLLRFWFRAVEQNAPWVKRIHFVTYGHVPEWLNTHHPKLHIVKHEDFIEKKFLPTFNSCAIEVNLHKIPGLAEKFVYFNDDMFVNARISPNLLFTEGKPKCTYVLTKLKKKTQADILRYNSNEAAKQLQKRQNLLAMDPRNGLLMSVYNMATLAKAGKTGFMSKHAPASYLKTSYKNVWEGKRALLEKVERHKFRNDSDCSQWVFEYYQLYNGLSIPRKYSISKYYDALNEHSQIAKDILQHDHKFICINDAGKDGNFNKAKKTIKEAFKKRYPDYSLFEKEGTK